MGSKSRKYIMNETGDTRSSAKKDEHKRLIEKFLDKGYEIESQESEDEEGLNKELISKSFTTILSPSNSSLPTIKFEANEIFGNYDYEKQIFDAFEFPKFELNAYKKGSDLKTYNDPWDKLDIS